MPRARVLILLQNEPVPSDRHVWNECRALVRAGYEVSVICPTGEDRDRELAEQREGVSIHRYEPRRAQDGVFAYLLEYASALWQIARLARRLARERRFDVVHACSPPDFLLLAALPLRRQGTRFIFDHHDLTPELYRSRFDGVTAALVYPLTLAAEQVAFRLADVVLSVNDSYREVAIRRGRRRPQDVVVVRTGPDLDRFAPVAPDPSLRRGREHLLAYVGVMGPQDGVDHALRALALLRERRADWHAVFMGDGSALGDMRRLASELGLADVVEFTGWVEHDTISRVLSTCDVCLAPDPKSPLNDLSSMVKLSEYMAMSRPIVSYDLAESRVAAAGAAVFAQADDEAGFANSIDELLGDAGLRRELGRAGRARAEQVLAWEHQERALLGAYERALGSARGRSGRRARGVARTAPSLELLELDEPRWHSLVDQAPGATPFHHPAWARLLGETYGYRAFGVVLNGAEGAPIAGAPFLSVRGLSGRRRWISLPFTDECAPLAIDAEAQRAFGSALAREAAELGAPALDVRADVPEAGWRRSADAVAHTLPLADELEAVRARFSRSQVIRNIRRAEREGVVVRAAASDADFEAFLALHLRTRRRQGVPMQPRRFFDLIRRDFLDAGLGTLLLASHEGREIAGALFLHWNCTTVYKFGASDPEGWPYRPNHLIFWTAIRESVERGDRQLDFGRTDLGNAGLRAFKSGWGGVERPLVTSSLGGSGGTAASGPAGRALAGAIRRGPEWVCRDVGALLYRFAATR